MFRKSIVRTRLLLEKDNDDKLTSDKSVLVVLLMVPKDISYRLNEMASRMRLVKYWIAAVILALR